MPRIKPNYGIVGNTVTTQTTATTGRMYGLTQQLIERRSNLWITALPDIRVSNNTTSFLWSFQEQGDLILKYPSEYTITFFNNLTKTVKMWGSGGRNSSAGSSSWGQGGAGGAATGNVAFETGTYIFRVPSRGLNSTSQTTTILTNNFVWGAGIGGVIFSTGISGSGGGYAGIFLNSVSQANAILMAGGGGGGAGNRADGLGGRRGTAGGGTTGESNGTYQAAPGTQLIGGAASGGSSPTSGSQLQGGNGAGGGGGGGGGYYGGGGGGTHGDGGSGGGGGSGYFSPTYVSSATLYTGTQSTPGNSTDSDRPTGTYGQAGIGGTTGGTESTDGAIIIKA